MLQRLTPSPSAPQNPVPDGRAGNSDLLCPKPNQITQGWVNTPNDTPPTQNFQGFVQDEDENIHVKITRNPADLESDIYNDSVIGLKKLRTIAAFLGRSVMKKGNSFNRFRFPITTFNSLRKCSARHYTVMYSTLYHECMFALDGSNVEHV